MVEVRCEARIGLERCQSDATVLRGVLALCDRHRRFPSSRLRLFAQDLVSLYHSIHPRNGKGEA